MSDACPFVEMDRLNTNNFPPVLPFLQDSNEFEQRLTFSDGCERPLPNFVGLVIVSPAAAVVVIVVVEYHSRPKMKARNDIATVEPVVSPSQFMQRKSLYEGISLLDTAESWTEADEYEEIIFAHSDDVYRDVDEDDDYYDVEDEYDFFTGARRFFAGDDDQSLLDANGLSLQDEEELFEDGVSVLTDMEELGLGLPPITKSKSIDEEDSLEEDLPFDQYEDTKVAVEGVPPENDRSEEGGFFGFILQRLATLAAKDGTMWNRVQGICASDLEFDDEEYLPSIAATSISSDHNLPRNVMVEPGCDTWSRAESFDTVEFYKIACQDDALTNYSDGSNLDKLVEIIDERGKKRLGNSSATSSEGGKDLGRERVKPKILPRIRTPSTEKGTKDKNYLPNYESPRRSSNMINLRGNDSPQSETTEFEVDRLAKADKEKRIELGYAQELAQAKQRAHYYNCYSREKANKIVNGLQVPRSSSRFQLRGGLAIPALE